jgi:hypothetical protein
VKSFLLALAGLSLAGCVDTTQPLSPDFGASVNANNAAQVINPDPSYDGPAVTDGKRMESAMRRYHTNKVYVPRLPLEGGNIYDTGNFFGTGAGASSSSSQQ